MDAAFDVIVAGLGVMGASIAREAARGGARVLGIDRLAPPHDRGSSHGRSRVIREAYFEEPLYVPLVQRAFDRWSELEAEHGVSIYERTGALMIGPPNGSLITGTMQSVDTHALPHEVLDDAAVRARYPALRMPDEMIAILETRAGTLAAEHAHRALLASALAAGATLRTGERLDSFDARPGSVRVTTSAGTMECAHLVLACGAWNHVVAGGAETVLPLRVERQVIAFFRPVRGPAIDAQACPILLIEDPSGDLLYTLPDAGLGLKAGLHHGGTIADPETIDRFVSEHDIERIRVPLGRYLPDADGAVTEAFVCMYTNTPDQHFLIDRLPGCERVIMASPCSGHGFKFAPVIGEIVASIAAGATPGFDITPFRMSRFPAGLT